MAQRIAYRPTPTNPTTHAEPQPDEVAASDGTDELLDDIDACLEENALEVVRKFVNRGGQ